MPIDLRSVDVGRTATLVHMGAGDVDAAVRSALRNHDEYVGIRGQGGLFCISMYACQSAADIRSVLDAMPHRQYGLASATSLAPRRLIATTPSELPPEVARLHVDFVVDRPRWLSTASRPADWSADDERRIAAELRSEIADVLTAFEPRQAK